MDAPASGTIGETLHRWAGELYPFCRSITGDGLRRTLRWVQRHVPLDLTEVPTGTPVLDWEVPREWNIRGGHIETLDGRRLVDFADSNLHVVNYSHPVDTVVSRDELARHIHTLPDQPDLIPYRTAYFADTWGFCLRHRTWEGMTDARYRVVIDSTLAPGALTYGQLLAPGKDPAAGEILISVHCCHPSLANDNLSGITVATALARRCLAHPGRLGVRFVFVPATIGAISWLAGNEDVVDRIRHGLVLSCIGDPGAFHYKRSRADDATVDRAVAHVLHHSGHPFETLPFSPYGYDERQYNSPGYAMPVGCFMRSPNGTFPEYHTSGDDLSLITADALGQSYDVLCQVLDLLHDDRVFRRVDGRGEPQLGRRGLYRAIAGQKDGAGSERMALLWVLNLADGQHSLLAMAERSGLPFADILAAARLCEESGLIVAHC